MSDFEKEVADTISEAVSELRKINEAFKDFKESGMNRRGIVALLADSTRLPKGTINKVLDALDNLDDYLWEDE